MRRLVSRRSEAVHIRVAGLAILATLATVPFVAVATPRAAAILGGTACAGYAYIDDAGSSSVSRSPASTLLSLDLGAASIGS